MIVVAVIIALSVIILFHEGGHFIFSKLSKIKIEEFGLGYPPRAVGVVKTKTSNKWKLFFGKKEPMDTQGTIYSLNLIPFGGFNKIKGEDGESTDADSFYAKNIWQRFLSIFGGILMNLVLAIILFSICFMVGMPTAGENKDLGHYSSVKNSGVQIVFVKKDSPAAQAGVLQGDLLISVDNQEIKNMVALSDYSKDKVGKEIDLKIKRGSSELDFKIIPQRAGDIFTKEELASDNSERGVVGITLVESKVVTYSFFIAIWQGIKTTFITCGKIIEGIYLILKELFVSHKMVGEAMGVVGIATFIGEAYQIGFIYFLQFLALVSVAIAVSQVLPIPALDGGRLVFLLIEAVRHKAISRKTEAIIHNVGFMVLILLMVFITYKDLLRLGDKMFK